MQTDWLKQEIAESHKQRKIKTIMTLLAIVATVGLVLNILQAKSHNYYTENAPVALSDTNHTAPSESTAADTAPKTNAVTGITNTKPSDYVPNVPALDTALFKIDGNDIYGKYSRIVSLVTFDPGDSNATKIDKINEARALEKSYFSSVTKLRGQLVRSDITSGEYLDATIKAEDAASKISIGLVFLGYWVDSQQLEDYNLGVGSIGAGANLLTDLASRLKNLN